MAGVRHSGLSNVTSSDTTTTDDLAVTDDLTVTGKATVGETLTVTGTFKAVSTATISGALVANGKCALGNAVSDSIGLYGVAKVSQRRSASQAALTTLTGGKTTTNVAAKLNALIIYDMRVRSDLIALGVIKGAA
jgi:predicted acyltransferase (DUF342 family)